MAATAIGLPQLQSSRGLTLEEQKIVDTYPEFLINKCGLSALAKLPEFLPSDLKYGERTGAGKFNTIYPIINPELMPSFAVRGIDDYARPYLAVRFVALGEDDWQSTAVITIYQRYAQSALKGPHIQFSLSNEDRDAEIKNNYSALVPRPQGVELYHYLNTSCRVVKQFASLLKWRTFEEQIDCCEEAQKDIFSKRTTYFYKSI